MSTVIKEDSKELDKLLREKLKEKFPYTTEEELRIYKEIMKFIGIREEKAIESYLKPSLKHFNHPFDMKDLEKGVDLLIEILDSDKSVLFYGDYDADGITTTALFVTALKELGYENIDWFLPSRHKEGYGVSRERVEEFSKKYDLIVTGDTGISEIENLHNLDIPVIITDHHEPIVSKDKNSFTEIEKKGKIIEREGTFMTIPNVEAIINPKRIDCSYPNKHLSGVAVVFKLLQGLYIKKGYDQKNLVQHLDLVAAGLVADLVPQFDKEHQDNEVRLMTALGLQIMNHAPKLWLQALCHSEGKENISFNDLGFFIGPRLNAPGRLGSPNIAVEFLLEEDEEVSLELAEELHQINEDRKLLQQKATESALSNLHITNEKIIVVRLDEEFHTGITGTVASNLSEEFQLPVIVFCEKEVDGETLLVGSCRSTEHVDIRQLLQEVKDDVGDFKFGGHKQAAGLTINESFLDRFKRSALRIAEEKSGSIEQSKLAYELEIPLNKITVTIINFIESSYHNIRMLSKENKMYSPPTAMKNPKWANVYLKKFKQKHIAVMWKRGNKIIEEYYNRDIEHIDVVYSASIWNNKISITVEDYSVR